MNQFMHTPNSTTAIPQLLIDASGHQITPVTWQERAKQIKKTYESCMYGAWPDPSQERVTYRLGDFTQFDKDVTMPDQSTQIVSVKEGSMTVCVTHGDIQSSFDTIIVLPTTPAPPDGYPIFSEMGFAWTGAVTPSANAYYAASRGYASVTWTPTAIAADRTPRTGAFYTLYPYTDKPQEQTGVLAAWGWGAAKILDALESGAATVLQINPVNNILGGVSRYGKAAAVAGAYEKRIKVVVPACSGAGGLAMYRYNSEGKTYDLSELGGPSTYTTTTNEFLASLTSQEEGHWFNDTFKTYPDVTALPVDQHFLAALIADPSRYLFIITGVIGEDWTNPAGMNLTYAAAKEVYDLLGISDHIMLSVHLQGHAITLEDMEALLDYCDIHLYGADPRNLKTDLRTKRTSVYFNAANFDESVFGAYVGNHLSDIDTKSLQTSLQTPDGATCDDRNDLLPPTVRIYVDTIRHMDAAIAWKQEKSEQSCTLQGRVILPEGITNPDQLSLFIVI